MPDVVAEVNLLIQDAAVSKPEVNDRCLDGPACRRIAVATSTLQPATAATTSRLHAVRDSSAVREIRG